MLTFQAFLFLVKSGKVAFLSSDLIMKLCSDEEFFIVLWLNYSKRILVEVLDTNCTDSSFRKRNKVVI